MHIRSFFTDSNGSLAVVQRPNTPLIVWAIATITRRLTEQGSVDNILAIVSFGALGVWALLEMFDGDSMFRRLLGTIILCITIYRLASG